jgi:hypothetical protein
VTLLDELELLLEEERAALRLGEIRAIEACVDRKAALCQALAALGPEALTDRGRLDLLRRRALHNAELAVLLSQMVNSRLRRRSRVHPIYDNAGRLERRPSGLLDLRG